MRHWVSGHIFDSQSDLMEWSFHVTKADFAFYLVFCVNYVTLERQTVWKYCKGNVSTSLLLIVVLFCLYSALSRVLEPTVFMEITLSDGSMKKVEVGNNHFSVKIKWFDETSH